MVNIAARRRVVGNLTAEEIVHDSAGTPKMSIRKAISAEYRLIRLKVREIQCSNLSSCTATFLYKGDGMVYINY
jgi:hypothetical protein